MSEDQARLYFESHITIDPVPEVLRSFAQRCASKYNFKLAKLLMDKGVDSPLDTFMTAHSRSRSDIIERTKLMVLDLQQAGFIVRRYKIEDTVVDSRSADEFGLIKPAGWTPTEAYSYETIDRAGMIAAGLSIPPPEDIKKVTHQWGAPIDATVCISSALAKESVESAAKLRVRANDPLSSVLAAERAGEFAGKHSDRIMHAMRECKAMGIATCAWRISVETGLTVVQVARRMPELQRAGLVKVATTPSGADIMDGDYRVWELVNAS